MPRELSSGLTIAILRERIAALPTIEELLDQIELATGDRPKIANPVVWVQTQSDPASPHQVPYLALADFDGHGGITTSLPDHRREECDPVVSSDQDWLFSYAETYGDDDIVDALFGIPVYEIAESTVCGYQIQWDPSGGQGHAWQNIDAYDIGPVVRMEIEAEIIHGGIDDIDDWVGSNGQHYRW